MGLKRYQNDPPIRGGQVLRSASAVMRIREAIKRGTISLRVHVIKEDQRLDHLAGSIYGDGRLWWVIAAASDIGWGLQVPPGTRIQIPLDLSEVAAVI